MVPSNCFGSSGGGPVLNKTETDDEMGWEDVVKDLDVSRIVLDILPEEVGTSSSVADCVHWLLDLTENVKRSVATEPDCSHCCHLIILLRNP